jgi:hypothetical protein
LQATAIPQPWQAAKLLGIQGQMQGES